MTAYTVPYADLFIKEEGRFFGDSPDHITAYNDIDAEECARRCLQGYDSYDGVNPTCLSFNHRPAGSPEGGSARCWLSSSDKDTVASPGPEWDSWPYRNYYQRKHIISPQDCTDVFALGIQYSHVYTIGHPQPFQAYCDMDTDGGGWTVIQRRQDGSVPFDRTWTEYEQGFGNVSGEYWLGLGNIHSLTTQKQNELYVYLEDWEMNSRFARYSTFSVGDASSKYTATIDGYSGDATDSLDPSNTRSSINNRQFSTTDQDNAGASVNCAVTFGQGGWWYTINCGYALLNGQYLTGCSVPSASCPHADGIVWYTWLGYSYSMKKTVMMIRPADFPVCSLGEFGPNCTGTCHCARGDSVCDIRTGVCSSGGCEAGWNGDNCQTACSPGEFGHNCSDTCHCASGDSVCDIRTGVCSSGGCEAGWKGVNCQTVCSPGEFGPNCSGTCRCASGDSVCDIRTGVCSSGGCEAGWKGVNCQTVCSPGEFGPNCSGTCRCASGDSVCDIRTGVCSSGGCEAGWKGRNCQTACWSGEFGPNCTGNCHCASGDSVCDIRTGVCSSGGCEAGWKGDNCQTVCSPGEFGPNCTNTCNCARGDSVCDIRTGVCSSGGCEAGWKGDNCQTVCSPGEFGPNCTNTCNCARGDSVCDIRTGVCSSGGCEAGWKGNNCQTDCDDGYYGQNCAKRCGVCVTGTTCEKADGRCSGCEDPWVGDTCKMVPATTLDHPDSFTVAIHDKATFSCTGRGVPAPTVVWHHDGEVITPGDQVSVETTYGGLVGEQHVTNSTLTITSARPHDSGQYVCMMSNTAGVGTSQEAALVVQVNPVVSIRPSEVQNLVVGEVISITCNTKRRSSDYTYQWTVDGAVVPNQRGAVFRYKAVSGVHKVRCKVTSPSGEAESEDSTISVLPKGTVTFVSSMRITGRNFTPEMENPESAAFQSISTEIKDWYQQALGGIQGNIYIRVKDAKPGSIITNQNVNVQDAELQDQDLFDSISNALQTAARTPSSLGLDPTSLTFLTTTCYGETVTVTDPSSNRVNLTFPDSAGDTHVYSEEKCANNTESAGVPLAVRRCKGAFQTGVTWARPELLDCGRDLSKLAEVPVTPDNVAEVAADLQILTSVGSSLMAENIADASTVLDNLVNTTGDENVGYSVVVSVDQIMNTDDDVLQQSQVNDQSLSRIVRAIEQFNDRVNLTSNRFRRIEKNIGVETYKVQAAEVINSVGFAFLDGSEDLEDGLVRSYSDSSSIPNDQVDASIVLPATAFLKRNISNPSAGEVRLSFIIYLNSRLFQSNQTSPGTKTRVNSRVIASRVTGIELKNLTNPVVTRYLPLVPNSTDNTVNNMRCVFWDFEAEGGVGAWSTEGCAFAGIDNDRVVCECNHLTNFAVLMDIYGGLHNFLLDLISKIGIVVSITGLTLTLISYLIFKQLRKTRPQHILTNLCIALLATLILFLTGIDATHSPIGCTIVAFLLHYFLLAVFMWMAVEAFNMYLAFIKVLGAHVSRFILKAAIFAWGLPLVIAIATLAVDVPGTYPNGQGTYRSNSVCWLQGNQLYYGFLLPAGLVLVFNTIVYIMVISKLSCGGRTDGKVAHPRSGATKQNLRIAIAIMVLVGLTWIFGFFMISDGRIVFSYLFCIFNSLQGFFIFIFHCLRQKEVRNLWLKFCGCLVDDSRATKYSTGTSSSNPTDLNTDYNSRGQLRGNGVPMKTYSE
ncbi:PREDICTED: uncharacterized protein LOC109481491 [Branchiostoma belcheri]|uniref:Uncharacterized protein LOC109481491 n=1 Tax=Branchiostoma belcheri TaxID=7741 RepID=A0A6P4ZEB8_BRABE|nr:PREDICTED: uncharacterized protein LOC109481491 [Branchiostoma belcheri]